MQDSDVLTFSNYYYKILSENSRTHNIHLFNVGIIIEKRMTFHFLYYIM